MNIKVVLADDHRIFRDGLRQLIDKRSDMEMVGEAGDGRTSVKLVREVVPDVVVMDVNMPDLNGIEATRQIISESPGVKIVDLSMHSDKRFVQGMLEAGASGYLLKNCAFRELVKAIHTVMEDRTYLCCVTTEVVVEDYIDSLSLTKSELLRKLTDREREVVQLMAEGKTTKEIATLLYISEKTVASHREHIMEKMHFHSLADLIKFALREGLTSLDF